MTGEYTPRRIFEVARELKISTSEIVEYLGSTGHDVTRKQMQPVNESMYIALLHKFDRSRFDGYLIAHGVVGEELRHLTTLLDEQKKKAQKAALPPPKPEPPKPKRAVISTRKIRSPLEKSETIKVTFFRRERPPQPAPRLLTAQSAPSASIFTRVGEQPDSIKTSPLILQLIKLVLALPIEQKVEIVNQLRLSDPR